MSKQFNREAFEEDMLNVLKRHFNIEYMENMHADIAVEPCWGVDSTGAILRISLKMEYEWINTLTEKEAKKYGKGLR